MIERRTFLQGSLAAGALVGLSCASSSSQPSSPAPKPRAKKSILILGGTGFLGPHTVETARERGHTLTLFNRGKTNPGMFPDIEQLHGDRDGKLEALAGRKWDAVIDNSGYYPRAVRLSAELLAPNVGQYIFISTISVYEDQKTAGMDESAPVRTLPPGKENVEEIRGEYYGALKAACEKVTLATFPGRSAVVRPGLIVGPGDPTDRFTYWPVRIDRGGEALAPGDGEDPVQYIDSRDLGAWLVTMVEEGIVGTYNALGPERRFAMKELLAGCVAASPSPATLTWVAADFLEKHEVSPWSDMPVWIPSGPDAVYGQMSNRAAVSKGLKFRPTVDTARDTLAWWKSEPEERRAKPKAGLAPEREKEVLAAWKARKP